MKRLILRNLGQRRMQTVTLTLSIAMSVMIFVALFMLYGGMSRGVQLASDRSGAHVLVIPSVAESSLEETDLLFTGSPVAAYFPADVADQIAQLDDVERVTVQFYGQTLNESCCSTSAAVRIIGFDPATDWVIGPYTDVDISGGLASDEVVIGCNITGFESGSGQILGNDVHVAARLAPTGMYLDNTVLMDINAIRQISASKSGFAHYWEKYGQPDDIVSCVLVQTVEGKQDAVAGKIRRKIDADVSVVVRSEIIAESQESLSVTFMVMLGAGVVMLIASFLQFMSRFYSFVWERKAELALYRAMGASRRDLKKLVGGEAAFIAGVGSVVGVVLGIVVYAALLAFMQGSSAFPFAAFPWWTAALGIVAIVVMFFVLAGISIIMPLRQVDKIDPASAMQQVDIG